MQQSFPVVIGISSCLHGQNVRYDGGNKLADTLLARVDDRITWYALCPEAGAGMGIPRPPIQLIDNHGQHLACYVDPPSTNQSEIESSNRKLTQQLNDYINETVPSLDHLAGYAFKARSPSCGVTDTPIRHETTVSLGSGLFAGAVRRAYPFLPIADENELTDIPGWNRFIERVFLYANWLHLSTTRSLDNALIEFDQRYQQRFRAYQTTLAASLNQIASNTTHDATTCSQDYWKVLTQWFADRSDCSERNEIIADTASMGNEDLQRYAFTNREVCYFQ